jgi:hypothetical protein
MIRHRAETKTSAADDSQAVFYETDILNTVAMRGINQPARKGCIPRESTGTEGRETV